MAKKVVRVPADETINRVVPSERNAVYNDHTYRWEHRYNDGVFKLIMVSIEDVMNADDGATYEATIDEQGSERKTGTFDFKIELTVRFTGTIVDDEWLEYETEGQEDGRPSATDTEEAETA